MTYAHLHDGAEQAVIAAMHGRADGIAVRTSGSAGTAREVLLSTRALRASARATHDHLHGPGHWLLALPTEHVAGAMVLVRSVLAGTVPVRMPAGSFTPEAFAAVVASMPELRPRYTSMVPTQLVRLLAHPAARQALATFDAVLVGGAALLDDDVPSNVIVTYGLTETCGGCVYDGLPLDGVSIALDAQDRILVRGETLMDGYSDSDDAAWVTHEGETYLLTHDVGAMVAGRLLIQGRADDAILTGGHKVHPVTVARALMSLPAVDDAVVVGIAHPEWGQAVAAVLESSAGELLTRDAVREALDGVVAPHERPHVVRVLPSLPRLHSGKIDRLAVQEIAQAPEM